MSANLLSFSSRNVRVSADDFTVRRLRNIPSRFRREGSPPVAARQFTRRPRAALLGALAVTVATGFFAAPSTRSAGTITTLAPAADAYVRRATPDLNYGALPTLSAQTAPTEERSYLRFDLGRLPGAVVDARLRLFVATATRPNVSVAAVADTTWSESAITYDNAPARGATVATTDITPGTWVDVDVTALARATTGVAVAVSAPPVDVPKHTKGRWRLRVGTAAFASRETRVSTPQLVVTVDGSESTTTTAAPPTTTSTPTTTVPTTTTAPPTTTTTTTAPPPASGCTGPALTSQSQVAPNMSYCGGVAREQIRLAPGDTWTNGEVTGVATGTQRGALECQGPCTLNNVSVHDVPGAFAALYLFGDHVRINGGRFAGAGSLGIGDDRQTDFVFDGVEVDHNGATASCEWEGGGIKLVSSHVTVRNADIHDNRCTGVWWDINGDNALVENSRIVNNGFGGIFFEISHHAVFRNNVVTGNGMQKCVWLWGAGIGIASSDYVEIYGNTLSDNCNGIGLTKQDRDGEGGTAHPLDHNNVHDNSIAGAPRSSQGWTGAASDDGTDLSALDLRFDNNAYSRGATFCGWDC
jgi:hypothetical protein